MKFKPLRYALAVISNAASQYVITDGQWGSPIKGLPLALELDIQSACHLIKAIEAIEEGGDK